MVQALKVQQNILKQYFDSIERVVEDGFDISDFIVKSSKPSTPGDFEKGKRKSITCRTDCAKTFEAVSWP
jgi:hypothetical protein